MSLSKKIIGLALRPVAQAVQSMAGFQRVWSHTRLSTLLAESLDDSVVVLGTPEVQGTRRIRLGRNLYLYRELYLETQGEGAIEIGDEVVISRGVHLVAFAGIHIGHGAMIGEYASIRDANHRFGEGGMLRYSGHTAKPIRIGNNAWIGRGVTVLGGVTIGDGAVIGANAVVTRDVAPGAVAAGVPARPLTVKVAS